MDQFIDQIIKRVTILLFISVVSVHASAHAEQNKPQFTIGIVPQFTVQELRHIWDPILLKVAQDAGIRLVFVGSPSFGDFEQKLLDGEFDLAYVNPYQMFLANQKQAYKPLVKDVGRSLHGILVVRKDSNISRISQLQNAKVVFPAPNALGASLMVRAELSNLYGINLTPYYVKNHSSAYLNVLLGQAKAGGGVMNTLNKQAKEIRNSLRIVHKTQEVAAHPIAIHPRVNNVLRKKIKKAFLDLGQTRQGKKLLGKIPLEKIGSANMDDYRTVGKMGLNQFVVR